jgi:hypothetical protein
MPNPFQTKFLPFNPVIGRRSPNPYNLFGGGLDPSQGMGTNPQGAFPQQVGNPNAIPPKPPERNFVDEYNKAIGNRPNRLAYQQAVQEGSPVIERGKWAKLGAAIAAGGSALGGTPAAQAAQFGLSSYYAPQMRSDERYNEKVKGLGNLAQFEDQDIQDKIKSLEFERGEHWKGAENDRQNAELILRQNEAVERAGLTKLQMEGLAYDLQHKGEYTVEDKNTGMSTTYDAKGNVLRSFKLGRTPAEHAADLEAEEAAKVKAQLPNRQSNERIAQLGVDKSNYAANKKYEGVVEAAKAKRDAIGKSLTPGQQAQKVWNDLSQKFNSDPELMGLNMLDFVDITAGPNGSQMIAPKPPYQIAGLELGDSETDKRVKAKISSIIAASLASGGRGVAQPNTPGAAGAGKPDEGGLRDFIKR